MVAPCWSFTRRRSSDFPRPIRNAGRLAVSSGKPHHLYVGGNSNDRFVDCKVISAGRKCGPPVLTKISNATREFPGFGAALLPPAGQMAVMIPHSPT